MKDNSDLCNYNIVSWKLFCLWHGYFGNTTKRLFNGACLLALWHILTWIHMYNTRLNRQYSLWCSGSVYRINKGSIPLLGNELVDYAGLPVTRAASRFTVYKHLISVGLSGYNLFGWQVDPGAYWRSWRMNAVLSLHCRGQYPERQFPRNFVLPSQCLYMCTMISTYHVQWALDSDSLPAVCCFPRSRVPPKTSYDPR